MQPIIITGGPGAGKTTLLNALGEQGYATFAEGSRTLIEQQSQLKDGVLPWTDLPRFAQLCLDLMAEQNVEHLIAKWRLWTEQSLISSLICEWVAAKCHKRLFLAVRATIDKCLSVRLKHRSMFKTKFAHIALRKRSTFISCWWRLH